MIKAILFDLDGVLWNTAALHLRAFNAALAPFGIHLVDYGAIAGRRTDDVMRRLLNGRADAFEHVSRLTGEKRLHFLRELEESPPDLQPIRQELARLARRYRLALCSSASRESISRFLELASASPLFEVVLCGDSVERAKPAPDLYAKALEALGATGEEAIVVEDSLDGIQAAHAAGLKVVGMRGTLDDQALREAGTDAVIGSLDELDAVLARMPTGMGIPTG